MDLNKRLIIAIALSFLVIAIWSKLSPSPQLVEQQRVAQQEPAPVSPTFVEPEYEQEDQVLLSAESGGRELVFSLPSACLQKIIFPGPDGIAPEEYTFSLGKGFELIGQDLVFRQEKLNSREAVFVHEDEQKRVTKRFNYSNPNYAITLDIEIENLSPYLLPYPTGMILGAIDLDSRGLNSRFKEVFIKEAQSAGMRRLSPAKATKEQQRGDVFGFRDRYFCAVVIPVSAPEAMQVVPGNCKRGVLGSACALSKIYLSRIPADIMPSQIGHLQYDIYIGPQDLELLRAFGNGAEDVLHYGFFDPISKLLLKVLRFFHRVVNNWGIAILIFSVFIFLMLLPLSIKQMHSMLEMQKWQPEIAKLDQIYKDNPKRLNKEKLELFRKHKINPLGGCLPLILQMPIFISLYQALMRSAELKGASFLWIKDLSQPDRLMASPEINILPILMAISMFLQQRSSMMPTGGAGAEQQKLMSFIFPVMLGFIFYKMPSGFVLYWLVNSSLMSFNQMRMKTMQKRVS